MTVYCARHERDDYEDQRFYRSLPTHAPSVVFHTRVPVNLSDGTQEFVWKTVSTWDLFAHSRVLVFSLPGAFTPTCSTYQLPDFERLAPEFLKQEGFDAIYCVSVNDSFVMNKWAQENNLENIEVIPDGSHKFTEAMNMLVLSTTVRLPIGSSKKERKITVKKIHITTHLLNLYLRVYESLSGEGESPPTRSR